MELFWSILQGNYHQSFIGIILIIITAIAYVCAPLRDDSWDQGLMMVQMLCRQRVNAVLALRLEQI